MGNNARHLLIAVALVAVFAFLVRADRKPRQSAETLSAATPVSVAGNWIADTGDVIQLRSDGTGFSRHLADGVVHECEFDWSCDGDMLTVENFPNVLGGFMAQYTGLQKAMFPVVTLSDDVVVFRHNGDITLTRGTGFEQPTIPATTDGEPLMGID